MAAFITSAAIVAATISTARGLYVQQERYDTYYGSGVNGNNFFSEANQIAVASPLDRVNSFQPSVAQRSFLERIDFAHIARPLETRIYSGLIELPECARGGGDYLFRVTSDDAAHLFIDGELVVDNGGNHPPVVKHGHKKLRMGKQYHLQLWWGNGGGPSQLKLEYCKLKGTPHPPREVVDQEDLTADLVDVLSGDAVDFHLNEDRLGGRCEFATDLRPLLKKHHEVLTIKRCDYDGYFKDDIIYFAKNDRITRWLPDGCVEEAGGIIALTAQADGVDQCTNKSFKFTTTIAARVSGMHTFWVQSDDGSSLYLDHDKIVDNPGYHGPRWKRGTVHLEKGDRKKLKVYYGNAGQPGMLNVMWEDHLMAEPQQSLLPIMV